MLLSLVSMIETNNKKGLSITKIFSEIFEDDKKGVWNVNYSPKKYECMTNEELKALIPNVDASEANHIKSILNKRPKPKNRVYKDVPSKHPSSVHTWVLGVDIFKHPENNRKNKSNKDLAPSSPDPRMETLKQKGLLV